MVITTIGLGLVGLVSSLRLCEKGHDIIGIDISSSLIDSLSKGLFPFHEPKLKEIFKKHLHKKFFIGDYSRLKEGDVLIICVNTPCLNNNRVNLSNFYDAVQKIKKESPRPVIIRSTIPPNTTESCFKQLNCPIVYYPEFLRQQKAWVDSINPSLKIYACLETDGEWFESLFDVDSTWHKTHIRTAEYIKYMNNSFHALKVTFTNEINVLGKKLGVDMNEAYQIFVSDHDLNISDKYLHPGLPFGGSCLEKDTRALAYLMKEYNVSAPLIGSINPSNQIHLQRILDQLQYNSEDTCGFIGLNKKKWDSSNFILNLAKKIKNSSIWEPNLGKINITPIKREYSLDHILKKSNRLVVSISKQDHSFWEKISSSKAEIFILDKNQVPHTFQKKRKFYPLRGDSVY